MILSQDTVERLNNMVLFDDTETDFITRLQNHQERFIEMVNQSELDDLLDIEFVKKIYDIGIKCTQCYLEGQLEESIKIIESNFWGDELDERMLESFHHPIYVEENELILFRLRKNDCSRLFNSSEMFHIAFENRSKVSNQRYSYAGYPCLYLGSSIYGCWEETGRPNVDMFNVIAVKNADFITFIDLRVPHFSKDTNVMDIDIYHAIITWLCSFKAANKDVPFIVEYVIPQMIVSSFVKNFNKRRKIQGYYRNAIPMGIAYTSSTYYEPTRLFDERELFTNYVIPVVVHKPKGLCDILCKKFKITETTSILKERITKNTFEVILGYEGERDSYEFTEFGSLERTMSSRNFSFIQDKYICPLPEHEEVELMNILSRK